MLLPCSTISARVAFSTIRRIRPTSLQLHSRYFTTYSSNMSSQETIKYHWIDGAEHLELYDPGGYHPIRLNDILNSRYKIEDKLGYGGYSTIWLGRDLETQSLVAIKVGIANSPQPRRELEILKKLSKLEAGTVVQSRHAMGAFDLRCTIPRVLDSFEVEGPNGRHVCYTSAPAQGNLRAASYSRLFPIDVARALAAGLALSVSFVHSQGFIHGDIHLKNVLTKMSPPLDRLSIAEFQKRYGPPETEPVRRRDGQPLPRNVPPEIAIALSLEKNARDFTLADAAGILLNDFGEAFSPITEQRLGRDAHIPVPRRAPEAFFEPDKPLSYESDIWSLGGSIWEILGMKYIFSEEDTRNNMLAQQIDVLGTDGFPSKWWSVWTRQRESGGEEEEMPSQPARPDCDIWPPLDDAFEEFIQHFRKRVNTDSYGDDERQAILELMRGMLRFDPKERWTMEQVLRSEWMVKWAIPSFQASITAQKSL